jgi:hypothetical protein
VNNDNAVVFLFTYEVKLLHLRMPENFLSAQNSYFSLN